MLRKGIIPPPAEAHHRAEDAPIPAGARSGGGDLRPDKANDRPEGQDGEDAQAPSGEGSQSPSDGIGAEEEGSSSSSPLIWIALALAGLAAGRFMVRRGDS